MRLRQMPLKAFAWTGHRGESPGHHQTTEIVAATSQRAAAAIVGETPARLFNLRQVPNLPPYQSVLYAKAMSEPGIVFWRPLDSRGADWTRVAPKQPPVKALPEAPTGPQPRFKHDCSTCKFLGHGTLHKAPVDWYTCSRMRGECRTLIARHSHEPSDYTSGTIGETVEVSRLVLAALGQGLDLNDAERNKLLKTLLTAERGRMGIEFWRDLMPAGSDDHDQIGTANWLTLEL